MNDFSHVNELPTTGFLRLPQVLSLIPVSRSSWFAGVKSGRYPKPVKLGTRTSAWRIADIHALIDTLGGQQQDVA